MSLSILYFILSWPSISFIRAFLIFLFTKYCNLHRHPTHFMHILLLTCCIVLLINPLQLFFLDFQLSFFLTFGHWAPSWFHDRIRSRYRDSASLGGSAPEIPASRAQRHADFRERKTLSILHRAVLETAYWKKTGELQSSQTADDLLVWRMITHAIRIGVSRPTMPSGNKCPRSARRE